MTALLSILKLTWPYVLCAIVAGYLTHRVIDVPRYDALQTALESYKAQVADANAKAQEAARDALESQIQTRLQTEANNSKVINALTQERDHAITDAALARGLLNAARKTASSGPAVPQAPDRSAASSAGGTSVGPSLETLTAAAIGECIHNADQLDALIAELSPQL